MSVSCWGSTGASSLGLKAVIELDTATEGGRDRGKSGTRHSHTGVCSGGNLPSERLPA